MLDLEQALELERALVQAGDCQALGRFTQAMLQGAADYEACNGDLAENQAALAAMIQGRLPALLLTTEEKWRKAADALSEFRRSIQCAAARCAKAAEQSRRGGASG